MRSGPRSSRWRPGGLSHSFPSIASGSKSLAAQMLAATELGQRGRRGCRPPQDCKSRERSATAQGQVCRPAPMLGPQSSHPSISRCCFRAGRCGCSRCTLVHFSSAFALDRAIPSASKARAVEVVAEPPAFSRESRSPANGSADIETGLQPAES